MKTTNLFLKTILLSAICILFEKKVIAQSHIVAIQAFDHFISLRGSTDLNHGIIWSPTVDGMEMRAYKGFIWTSGTFDKPDFSEKMRLDANGNLGINNKKPQFKLDVIGRGRMQTGLDGTAGFWLTNILNNKDIAFMGVLDDNRVGMYGLTTGWDLTMDVNNGNVGIGIGVRKAAEKLEVDGSAKINGSMLINYNANTTNATGIIKLLNNHNTIGDKWFLGFGAGSDGAVANDMVRLQTEATATGGIFSVISGGKAVPLTEKFRIDQNGKVGIGTNAPTEMLTVSGNIKCSSVISDATKFPDYVFKKGYILQPLGAVSTYIQTNNKLPGMPSEAEVLKNGLNIPQVTIAAVEKIEELYLYNIELNEKIKELNTKMKVLEDVLNKINKK